MGRVHPLNPGIPQHALAQSYIQQAVTENGLQIL